MATCQCCSCSCHGRSVESVESCPSHPGNTQAELIESSLDEVIIRHNNYRRHLQTIQLKCLVSLVTTTMIRDIYSTGVASGPLLVNPLFATLLPILWGESKVRVANHKREFWSCFLDKSQAWGNGNISSRFHPSADSIRETLRKNINFALSSRAGGLVNIPISC